LQIPRLQIGQLRSWHPPPYAFRLHSASTLSLLAWGPLHCPTECLRQDSRLEFARAWIPDVSDEVV